MESMVLSIKQVEHLCELGLDLDSSSMCWVRFFDKKTDSEQKEVCMYSGWLLLPYDVLNMEGISISDDVFNHLEVVPTLTLQDILELLPKEICSEEITICHYCRYWGISYHGIYSTESENLLEAAYNMLCCCLENGDIKSKEE